MNNPRIEQSIFTRGAVDLSALAARATPAPAAASPSSTPPAPEPGVPAFTDPTAREGLVVEVTEANFQETVERSMTMPVVLNFGMLRADESRAYSATLARLNAEDGGDWLLANVDVDANPRIAQALRVQQVPMVYALVGGQPIDAQVGVLPEHHLRQWLDAIRKAAGLEVAVAEDPRLAAADDLLMNGDLDAAEAAYRKILNESPAEESAQAGLAQVGLYRRLQGVDPATALAAAAAAPDDIAKQSLAADVEVISGEADKAYLRLVDLIKRSAGPDKDAVRKHLIELFAIAGPDDPAVAAARKALASALF